MKKIFFLALFVSGVAYAQNFKNDSLLKLLPGKSLSEYVFPKTFNNNNSFQNLDASRSNNLAEIAQGLMADNNAKSSHHSSLGSVYILSEDGMPCLIPNLQKVERMPGRKLNDPQSVDRMPNGFPKQKF
ncbi:MAG TPA: hypothetical protein VHZ50_08165 [Puia sp.]|jgi:hypothetical protein|nr:hypothetical protein [Puia sp.]